MRNSINEVLREASIAAILTALMILLFLGSWRSTLIVCISIPLSILTSICIPSALGETINVMTLGGLALAVGILVDDATVEIENTALLVFAQAVSFGQQSTPVQDPLAQQPPGTPLPSGTSAAAGRPTPSPLLQSVANDKATPKEEHAKIPGRKSFLDFISIYRGSERTRAVSGSGRSRTSVGSERRNLSFALRCTGARD